MGYSLEIFNYKKYSMVSLDSTLEPVEFEPYREQYINAVRELVLRNPEYMDQSRLVAMGLCTTFRVLKDHANGYAQELVGLYTGIVEPGLRECGE